MNEAQVARIVARWIGAFPYPPVSKEMMQEIGDSTKKYEYEDAGVGVTRVRDSYTNSVRPAIAVLRNSIIDVELERIRADNNRMIDEDKRPTRVMSDADFFKMINDCRASLEMIDPPCGG